MAPALLAERRVATALHRLRDRAPQGERWCVRAVVELGGAVGRVQEQRDLAARGVAGDAEPVGIDAVPIGEARDRDSQGRDLPVWQGCRIIAEGEVFLMNLDVSDSLDGRYFGPLPVSTVIGQATPLFTDEDGDGRFVWRAPMR